MDRLGRPPLTERRKAATRLEIACAAVRLFTTRGLARTSAEDIADAAGISVRTLWRYFPSKESCVRPLLTAGIDSIERALGSWLPGQGIGALADSLERAAEVEAVTDLPTLLGLVRLTRTEPALRAVWMQAYDDAEPVIAAALAQRAGEPAGSLAIWVQAAVMNAALRAAVEHYAWSGAASEASYDQILPVIRTALLIAAQGLPDAPR